MPRLQREEAEHKRLERQLAEGQERLRPLEEAIGQQAAIEEGYRLWQERGGGGRVAEKQLVLAGLQAQRAQVEGEIRAAQAALQAEMRGAEARLTQWREQAARAEEFQQAAAQAQARLEGLTQKADEATERRAAITRIVDEVAGLRMQNDLLKAEMEPLKEKSVAARGGSSLPSMWTALNRGRSPAAGGAIRGGGESQRGPLPDPWTACQGAGGRAQSPGRSAGAGRARPESAGTRAAISGAGGARAGGGRGGR